MDVDEKTTAEKPAKKKEIWIMRYSDEDLENMKKVYDLLYLHGERETADKLKTIHRHAEEINNSPDVEVTIRMHHFERLLNEKFGKDYMGMYKVTRYMWAKLTSNEKGVHIIIHSQLNMLRMYEDYARETGIVMSFDKHGCLYAIENKLHGVFENFSKEAIDIIRNTV